MASACALLKVDILLKKAFWRSRFFYSKSGVGPKNESTIGVSINAFAEPRMTMPIHILKKTSKKYEFCYKPTIRTAISVAMHPCKTLEPMRLRAT